MYGIYSYIWLIFMVNVGKYTSPMDPMGNDWFIFMVNGRCYEFPPQIFPVPDKHIQASFPEFPVGNVKSFPRGEPGKTPAWAIVMTQLDSLLLMLQKSLRAQVEVGSLSMNIPIYYLNRRVYPKSIQILSVVRKLFD